MDLKPYDYILVAFSGGKDSLACILHLLEIGADRGKIELWHHIIDGREGSALMDWPVTEDYCRKVAEHLKIPIYYSWKTGGFEGEMLREDALTRSVKFETPDGLMSAGGKRGKKSTRRKFPQVSGDLRVRWCSAYLKIDVMRIAINNQKRFLGKNTLVVTGERAQESPGRAKYKEIEPYACNGKKRKVTQWRPVHKWMESDVWRITGKHGINPHPAYHLGWGRLSCAACIFGSPSQWVSLLKIAPKQFMRIFDYEKEFDCTIHRTENIAERAMRGDAYKMDERMIEIAMSRVYEEKVYIEYIQDWKMPAGAFNGDSAGPT